MIEHTVMPSGAPFSCSASIFVSKKKKKKMKKREINISRLGILMHTHSFYTGSSFETQKCKSQLSTMDLDNLIGKSRVNFMPFSQHQQPFDENQCNRRNEKKKNRNSKDKDTDVVQPIPCDHDSRAEN